MKCLLELSSIAHIFITRESLISTDNLWLQTVYTWLSSIRVFHTQIHETDNICIHTLRKKNQRRYNKIPDKWLKRINMKCIHILFDTIYFQRCWLCHPSEVVKSHSLHYFNFNFGERKPLSSFPSVICGI